MTCNRIGVRRTEVGSHPREPSTPLVLNPDVFHDIEHRTDLLVRGPAHDGKGRLHAITLGLVLLANVGSLVVDVALKMLGGRAGEVIGVCGDVDGAAVGTGATRRQLDVDTVIAAEDSSNCGPL